MKYSVIKHQKVIVIFKIETPKIIWIYEFVCLRSKAYSFKCGDDIKNKLKRLSKPQRNYINSEECKKCLDGREYQRGCDTLFIKFN